MGACFAATRLRQLTPTQKTEISRYFTPNEYTLLSLIFSELYHRSQDNSKEAKNKVIHKEEFLFFFPLSGLWGDNLFKVFDSSKTKAINFYTFLMGIYRASRASLEDKIRVFFSIYDMENHGYLTIEDLTRMLLNYPISDISKITDGFLEDQREARRMRKESMQLNVSGAAGVEDSKIESMRLGKIIADSVSQSDIRVASSVVEGSEGIKLEPSKSVASKGSVQNGPSDPGLKLARKNSNDSTQNYQTKCTTINNKIKNYVANLMQENDPQQTGKFTYENFRNWVKLHMKVIDHFEENFHVSIWRSDNSEGKDILGYKKHKPDLNFYANYSVGPLAKKKERVWVELHSKFFIISSTKEDPTPQRVVLLDGLSLTLPPKQQNSEGRLFVLSYSNEYYKQVTLEIEDEEAYSQLVKKLSYLQEAQCKTLYNFLGLIGTGKFSKVYKASKKSNPSKIVAIKQIDLGTIEPEEKTIIMNEVAIIKVLHHPNIIRYFETYQTKNTIYIACEYMRDGQLFDYIIERGFLEETEASLVMEQLLSTVNYLHNSSIVHRDLKPENIMIEREYDYRTQKLGKIQTVKLIDFGFACYLSDELQMSEPVGTPNYVAPEVYVGKFDQRSDLFSLGVILYFMIRGQLPFASPVPELVIRKTMKGDYHISDLHWAGCSPEAVDLVTRLLEGNQDKRISMAEASLHPFIRNRQDLKQYEGANRKKEGDD